MVCLLAPTCFDSSSYLKVCAHLITARLQQAIPSKCCCLSSKCHVLNWSRNIVHSISIRNNTCAKHSVWMQRVHSSCFFSGSNYIAWRPCKCENLQPALLGADNSDIIKHQIATLWQFSQWKVWKLSSAQAGRHQDSGTRVPEA